MDKNQPVTLHPESDKAELTTIGKVINDTIEACAAEMDYLFEDEKLNRTAASAIRAMKDQERTSHE